MKRSRSLIITIRMVVLAICTAVLLSGCASIGDRKDAGPEMESPRQIDEPSEAVEETSGSSPKVLKEPVVNTGSSGEKSQVQELSLKSDDDSFKRYAAYLIQGLDRILPETLPDIDWNRLGTVLGGVAAMLLIYGLAFGLARLPLRRRGVRRSGSRRQTGEQARESVAH